MKVTKHKIDPRKQFEIGGGVYHLIGVNNKEHLLYARFTKTTDKLTGFFVDNGVQLKEIDITKLSHEDFKKQKGQTTHPQVRKLGNPTKTIGRNNVSPNHRNRKV